MNKLNHHLRQYRHNNNDGLIHGYERKGTDVFVSCLESEIADLKRLVDFDTKAILNDGELIDSQKAEIAELKKQVADLTLVNAGVNSRLTKSIDLHNDQINRVTELNEHRQGQNRCIKQQRSEIDELKAQIELLKNKLGDVVLSEQNNSGYEPSLSCFQREITEASILLAKTPRQCLASAKADAVKEFVASGVSPNSKAGCIGEFQMTAFQVCPECWQNQDDYCELCNGETDENGHGETKLDIPWTIQKDIFKAMLNFKHEYHENKIREAANETK